MKKQIIRDILDKQKADAVLLYSPQNRYWFSRFHSSLGYLLVTKEKSFLLLDGRYITAAKNSSDLVNVDDLIEFGSTMQNPFVLLNELIKENKIKKVLFESDWVFYNDYINWDKSLLAKFEGYNFDSVREIKDNWEIEKIRKACDITHKVFLDVLKFVKPGMTEKELARFVSDTFLKHGAEKLSFDTIVASGENGSMPHAVPSDKKIKENEFITLDMGCYYKGYCSDQTRTFAIGNKYDPKLKEIYDIVYESQSAGIEMIKPGVKCAEVHKKCFEIIEAKGYGKYFTHGTGHGIGVEIHEEPYNANGSSKVLQENMCVTVEPGIYIPEVGGVRIEDDILVTKNGYEFLTEPYRELVIIKVKK